MTNPRATAAPLDLEYITALLEASKDWKVRWPDHGMGVKALIAAIPALVAEVERLREALRAILGNCLLEDRDSNGVQRHDWRTCDQFSCSKARAALGEPK